MTPIHAAILQKRYNAELYRHIFLGFLAAGNLAFFIAMGGWLNLFALAVVFIAFYADLIFDRSEVEEIRALLRDPNRA